MRICFRVDSSTVIGTGHVMRCLTLANELRRHGADCSFVCVDHPGSVIGRIRADGFPVNVMPQETVPSAAAYEAWLGSDWENDCRRTGEAMAGGVDWLVVDHYGLDRKWERTLRPLARRILVIDDLANRDHDADLLLDQNIVHAAKTRYDGLVPEACGRMLGPRFALLQPIYADLHRQARLRTGPISRILIFFGGADTDNLTGCALEAFLGLYRSDIQVDVVESAAAGHAQPLAHLQQGRANITVHRSLPTLAPLLASADLAIGAGGTSSWERCCLGLPALVVTLAENQVPIARALHDRGLIRWLGDKTDVTVGTIASALEDLLADGLPVDWSSRCLQVVDGLGAARVAGFMGLSASTPLRARLAEPADEIPLLEWANDPVTRRNGFSAQQIDGATHHQWFSVKLKNPNDCRFYIVETEAGLAIGQVRFERVVDGWELHYSLDPCARGRGVGRSMLGTAIAALRADLSGSARLFARVRATNVASIGVVKRLAFRPVTEQDQIITFELQA